jgi:hypothetical protein
MCHRSRGHLKFNCYSWMFKSCGWNWRSIDCYILIKTIWILWISLTIPLKCSVFEQNLNFFGPKTMKIWHLSDSDWHFSTRKRIAVDSFNPQRHSRKPSG